MTATAATGDSLAALLDRHRRDRRPLRDFVDESGLQALVVAASKDPNAKVTTLLVSPASGRAVLAVKAATTETARTISRPSSMAAHFSR